MTNSPETYDGGSHERLTGAHEAAEAQAESLKDKLENGIEQSPDARAEAVEKARAEANKEALLGKERGGAENKSGGEPTASGVRKVTKKQKNAEYKKTMSAIQSEMTAPARAFSKVIHNPAVEKTSDIIGNTIARPNAILAGGIAAFVAVALVYFVAKQYGYVLSGSESIAAFILGWLFGVSFDYLRVLIRGSTK